MKEDSLLVAFSDSLKEETVTSVSELVEVGLDSILEDGLLKDVPLLSTTIALYKIGSSLKERHNIKKLIAFLDEINKKTSTIEKRAEYQQKISFDEKFRNQQIEYLLVLIDRYISYDKPRMLAKLFVAYIDGIITWEELTMYAEIIDRFLLLDVGTFTDNAEITIVHKNIGGESVLRLVALGLMIEETNMSLFEESEHGFEITSASMQRFSSKERCYKRTEFGEKLAHILK